MTSTGFEHWAIVELFGHNVIAGMVTEEVIAGQGFVRVDVPAVEGEKAFTKFYGPTAVYGITPVDSDTALAAVKGLRRKPIEVWMLNLPALTVDHKGHEESTDDPTDEPTD